MSVTCRTCNATKLDSEFHLSRHGTPELQCKECKHEYQRQLRARNYDTERYRFYNLKSQYGMTKEQFYHLFEKQGGSCATCGKNFDLSQKASFHVDHDHSCCDSRRSCGDCVRGLLCRNCNLSLGYLEDNTTTLRNMIEYLDRRSST